MRKNKATINKTPSIFLVLIVILILSALLSYVFKDNLKQLNEPVHITELKLNELTPEVRNLVETSNENLIKMQLILNRNNLSEGMLDSDKNTVFSLLSDTTSKMNEAVKLEPENADLWYYRCNLYKKLSSIEGSIDVGIESCLKSIELNSKNPDVYFSLGGLYITNKDYNSAIEVFTSLIEITPNDMNAYHNLGYAYLQNGDKEQAKKSYLKALELAENK